MIESVNVFIDGACRGNPGEGAAGFIVYENGSKEIYRYGKKIGYCTNNSAEYMALIEALTYLNSVLPKEGGESKKICIYSDSELLVNQINGKYRVKNPRLKKLFESVRELMSEFGENISIRLVPRQRNREADRLVNMILDGKLDF